MGPRKQVVRRKEKRERWTETEKRKDGGDSDVGEEERGC